MRQLNISITPFRLALAVFLFAAVALAAGNIALDYNERWVQGRLTVGTTYGTLGTKRIVPWTCDYDFPSTSNGYCFGSTGKPCTATGVKLGSPCFVGVRAASPTDGGSAWYSSGVFYNAIARADNLIEVQECNRLGDAGVIDLPDSGFVGFCLDTQ